MISFYWNELLLTGIMLLAAMVCLAIDGWKNARMFAIAMVVGGACENIAVMLGAWGYSNAGYLFAPLWLPVGWGMAVVFIEEAFSKNAHLPGFSKKSLVMAFGGTIMTGIAFSSEIGVLVGFLAITMALLFRGYYHRSEVMLGIMAAVFGTVMETACIMAGNWHYNAAMFGTPLWLPLCWFNAFLIMRRITKI
jgi:uncharacterized membrane protein YoaT (DUF817 family)